MKIVICGSMAFAKEMIDIKEKLERKGHNVIIPKNVEEFAKGKIKIEKKWVKIKDDVIRSYFEKIKNCDAVLILNKDKNNIKNYVGGNGLIEMAFAHVFKKKIFLLNPVPQMDYTDEIEAMKPIVLNGDLSKIR